MIFDINMDEGNETDFSEEDENDDEGADDEGNEEDKMTLSLLLTCKRNPAIAPSKFAGSYRLVLSIDWC
jgi:hypothetical protein